MPIPKSEIRNPKSILRCPTLSELPPPPPGKTGWPWTEESPQLPDTMPDGRPWPRVSIVTPSYNQAQFIEETIRSVLLQGYPNLEYIIIDGGSTDSSVGIIKKYEPWLSYWVSEPDRGQAHAINKGFQKATGEILTWLNSDDVYLPGAARTAVKCLISQPETAMVYGDCRIIDEHSQVIDLWKSPDFSLAELPFKCFIPQQTVFFRREVLDQVGLLKTDLHYALDYDLWLRLAPCHIIRHIPTFLAEHRKCGGTKTVTHPEAFWPEIVSILHGFFADPALPSAIRALEQDAYAIAYLHEAFQCFQLGEIGPARARLRRAFEIAPGVVSTQRERITRMLMAYANGKHSPAEARVFLDLVAEHLPPNAEPLTVLRNNVLRRIHILHASRRLDGLAWHNRARLVLLALIHDIRWCLHPSVRPELVKLILGAGLTRRIAIWKQRWAGFQRQPYPKGPYGP